MAKAKKEKRPFDNTLDEAERLAPPVKRIRKYDDEAAQLGRLCTALASELKEQRLRAAESLVNFYQDKTQKPGRDRFDTLERPLTRLTRGLCSNRKAARLGFYAALSEILHLLFAEPDDFEPELVVKYLKLIEQTSRADSQASKQEVRDHLIGYVLAHEALLQNDLLLRSEIEEPLLHDVVEKICYIARRHQWLREECGLALYKTLNRAKQKTQGPRIAKLVLDVSRASSIVKTPEGIAIWLQAMEMGTEFPQANQIWHDGNPLSPEELDNVALILKQGHADSDRSKSSLVEKWTSINFAWDVIFRYLLSRIDIDQDTFDRFWRLSVHDVYFHTTASTEMKYRGFQILDRIVKIGPPRALKCVLGSNIILRLVNQCSNSNRYLHDAALRILDAFVERGRQDLQAGLCIIEKLLSPPDGIVDFDKRTGTKTIEKLCSFIKPSDFEDHLLPALLHQVLHSTKYSENPEYFYQCIADLYLKITRRLVFISPEPSLDDLNEISSSLECFARHGFVRYQSWRKTKIPKGETHFPLCFYSTFRAKFFSCLSQILSLNNDAFARQILNIPGVIQRYGPENVVSLVAAESAILESVAKAEATYRKLADVALSGHEKDPKGGAALFLSIMLLRAYDGEEDAIGMLDELQETAEDILQPHRPRKVQIAVNSLVDLILSSLSVPSALSRRVAESAFATLSPAITAEGLEALVNPLLDNTPLSSVEETHGSEVSDISDDDRSTPSSDPPPSSSLLSLSGEDNQKVASLDPIIHNQDHSDDTSDTNESEEDRFNTLLAEALSTSNTKHKETRSGSSTGSDDVESMDDEQMMKLDSHLSAIFRERRAIFGEGHGRSRKAEKHKSIEQNTNFKNRILDLLSIYTKQQYDSDLGITGVILPILRYLGKTSNKQSAGKASELLRKYFDTARAKGMPKSPNRSLVLGVMQSIHEEALEFASKQHTAACSRASLFLAKILFEANWENHAIIVKMYADTAHAALEKESKLPPSFLTDGMNWSRSLKT